MQHNDDRPRNRVVRLDRSQRGRRQEDHPAGRAGDEVSRCQLSPEREAHRSSFNPNFEPTTEQLIGLLPDATLPGVKVSDVCKKTLFLANLLGSPYVRLQ